MYNNEIIFINKFLSALRILGVTQIPFRNEAYRNGVYEMKRYFTEIQSQIDRKYYDIKMLFINNGESDFAEGIMNSNDGDMISFELKNPLYEWASVKINEEDAIYILQDKEFELSNDIIMGLTKAFCAGAGVKIH